MAGLGSRITQDLVVERIERRRVLLWVVLAISLAVRLYGVGSPLTDGGQERQTQVATIARNLYRENPNVLYPRMDFVPRFYAMLEFPLQAAIMATLYHVFGIHDAVGRLVTIAFSLGSIVFMYLVARRFLSEDRAVLAAAVYALTPMSIYFGRAVFPEALLLFFSLGALHFTLEWTRRVRRADYFASVAFAAAAFIVKAPPGIVMVLPIAAAWWTRWKRDVFRRVDFYLYFVIAAVPITLWALWSNHIGSGDPGWNAYQISAIRRWGIPDAWFTKEFYTWTSRSVFLAALTPAVAIMAAIGLIEVKQHRLGAVVYAWVLAMVVFILLTPGGQATHWNYQVPVIPVGSLLAVIGIPALWSNRYLAWSWHLIAKRRATAAIAAVLIIVGYIAIYAAMVRDAYDPLKRVPFALEVAHIVQQHIPKNGVVALLQTNMVPASQTYYMDRKVLWWEVGSMTIPNLEKARADGVSGLVIVDTPYGDSTSVVRNNPHLLAYIRSEYRTIIEAEHYLIYAR